MFKVMSGTRPSHPAMLKESPRPYNQADLDLMWPLIEKCWKSDPAQRPTARNIISQLSVRKIQDTRQDGDWGLLNPSCFRNTANVVKQFFSCTDIEELINLVRRYFTHSGRYCLTSSSCFRNTEMVICSMVNHL